MMGAAASSAHGEQPPQQAEPPAGAAEEEEDEESDEVPQSGLPADQQVEPLLAQLIASILARRPRAVLKVLDAGAPVDGRHPSLPQRFTPLGVAIERRACSPVAAVATGCVLAALSQPRWLPPRAWPAPPRWPRLLL